MGLPASIGIVGGMGPWVDPLLLQKLLSYQSALGMCRDQEAIPVVLAQFSALLEDRTECLAALEAGRASGNPAIPAARVARLLAAAGARVVGIPCNTFHAPAIFEVFERELAELSRGEDRLEVVHMIRAAVEAVRKVRAGLRRVGVLSTNGTYLHRIYAATLEEHGLEAVTLPYEPRPMPAEERAARRDAILGGRLTPLQNDVHHAISDAAWGIKSGRQAGEGYPAPRAVLKAAARRLPEAGAEALILGCTEIPLALGPADVPELPMTDPLEALARELVEAWRRRFNPAWPAARELPFLPGWSGPENGRSGAGAVR